MSVLVFEIGVTRRIFEHAARAIRHRMTMEQLYDSSFYKGGNLVIDSDGLPDESNLDFSKVPKQVFLVKGQGVYLESAGLPELAGRGGSVRAYAQGCNPANDHEWHEVARTLLGASDLVMPIPVRWFAEACQASPQENVFQLRVTGATIAPWRV